MTELIEGCNHECEMCSCCDDCSFYQNQGLHDYHMYKDKDYVIRDMVEEEIWNKENLQFEKKFVYEDKRKYWRKLYKKTYVYR